tara:strand:- start:1336 stop:1596 length:261 start_codon:yes stop_codon:yes gene_type:complete
MFGFTTFAGAPFASAGKGAVFTSTVFILGEAIYNVNANVIWNGDVFILGEADIKVDGTINGSGWIRQNPDTPEWDVAKSKDWNRTL